MYKLRVLVVMAVCLGLLSEVAEGRTLCGNISVDGELDLTHAEHTLVCGDDETRAWSDIPLRQAAYFLKVFLANRGYHQVETRFTDNQLHIVRGPLAVVRNVILETPGIEIDVSRYWRIRGAAMTPKALDELEKWIKTELGREGRACAVPRMEADPVSGVVRVRIENAKIYPMPQVRTDVIEGMNADVPRRYDAFSVGAPYNALKIDLSARRMISQDVVLNTNFVTNCQGTGGLRMRQEFVPGEPRLLSFGIGFDTEEFLIAEAGWRHHRLGMMASTLEVAARTSYRRQSAMAMTRWYYSPLVERHYLRSSVTYERENERRYDARSLKVRVGPAWDRDFMRHYAEFWLGGAYEHTETVRGEGPATAGAFLIEAETRVQSHDFEYYLSAPRSGHAVGLAWQRARQGLGASYSAVRWRADGTALWNLFHLDPPIWILGLRSELSATMVGAGSTEDDIPITLKNFLGGSQNLRGFGRNAVPAEDTGALATAYLGTEMRIQNVLPFDLQPLLLADFAKIGDDIGRLQPDMYWSPGVGMHWQSPFGTLRTTLAHGFIEGPASERLDHLSRWQLYVSYGEQF